MMDKGKELEMERQLMMGNEDVGKCKLVESEYLSRISDSEI